MSRPEDSQSLGRRNYDVEITKLEFQVADLKEEVKELRADIKDLIEAWKSAKGMTAFVKWIAGVIIALGVIAGAIKIGDKL